MLAIHEPSVHYVILHSLFDCKAISEGHESSDQIPSSQKMLWHMGKIVNGKDILKIIEIEIMCKTVWHLEWKVLHSDGFWQICFCLILKCILDFYFNFSSFLDCNEHRRFVVKVGPSCDPSFTEEELWTLSSLFLLARHITCLVGQDHWLTCRSPFQTSEM